MVAIKFELQYPSDKVFPKKLDDLPDLRRRITKLVDRSRNRKLLAEFLQKLEYDGHAAS
jgi:hypothetical protein